MIAGVALTGRRGTGKDTVAAELVRRGFHRFAWADPVRQIAAMAYDPRFVSDDPAEYAAAKAATFMVKSSVTGIECPVSGTWILQRIGTDAVRDQVDADFWIKAGLARISRDPFDDMTAKPKLWVNTDTRFPNEVEALRSRGFRVVRLTCDDSQRVERLIGRDGRYDAAADHHVSEQDLTSIVDFTVDTTNRSPKAIATDVLAWREPCSTTSTASFDAIAGS